MASWEEFSAEAPDLADFGLARIRNFGVGLGFLATVTPDGAPRVAPVCPVLAGGRLFISAGKDTPKVGDLRREPRFMLHSFPDKEDPEFTVRGTAKEIRDEATRKMIVDAVDFAAYDPTDPIFELDIERADSTTWENWATPETRPIRKKWIAGL